MAARGLCVISVWSLQDGAHRVALYSAIVGGCSDCRNCIAVAEVVQCACARLLGLLGLHPVNWLNPDEYVMGLRENPYKSFNRLTVHIGLQHKEITSLKMQGTIFY